MSHDWGKGGEETGVMRESGAGWGMRTRIGERETGVRGDRFKVGGERGKNRKLPRSTILEAGASIGLFFNSPNHVKNPE